MIRVYNSKAWRRCRAVVLARADGQCETCGHPAQVVDHTPPLRDQLAAGMSGTNPDACRALCRECSGRADGARREGGRANIKGAGALP